LLYAGSGSAFSPASAAPPTTAQHAPTRHLRVHLRCIAKLGKFKLKTIDRLLRD